MSVSELITPPTGNNPGHDGEQSLACLQHGAGIRFDVFFVLAAFFGGVDGGEGID